MSEAAADQAGASGSLRLRFLLAISLWVVLGTGTIWLSATSVFEEHVEQSYHEELEVHVRELARLTRIGADGQPELTRPLSDPRYEVPLSGFYWQVTTPGRRPLRSLSMTRGQLDEDVAHSPDIFHAVENGPTGPTITYGFVRPRPDGAEVHFVIATDQAELDRLIDSFTRELTFWLVGLGALLLATGLTIIGFGLRPLGRLSEAMARLRRGEADRLEGRYPREIAPLVAEMNAFIRQSAEMLARARVQAGNLAHSLRTPLAVITDEAERLAEGDPQRFSAKVLLAQAATMQQQIEYQLARARSSSGMRVPGSSSRLPELLMPILAAMRRLHPAVDFRLDQRDCASRVLPVDPVDFAELLSILIDNAGKWAREAVTITLSCPTDGSLEIAIADDGPGMSKEQIARAFELGSRFDKHAPGSGLGLAIARDICEELGGEIALCSTSQGLTARLRLAAP